MLKLVRKIFPYFWPYRFSFLFAALQVLLINAFELLKPWPLKFIIDYFLSNKALPWEFLTRLPTQTLLWIACISIVLFYLFAGGFTLLNDYTTIVIGHGMVNNLRGKLFAHLQKLSLAFHNRSSLGDLIYRIATDTYAIQTVTTTGIFSFFSASILFVGMFIVMMQLDELLTLLALSVCPALFIATSLMSAQITSTANRARQQESKVYSLIERTMSNIPLVQAFTKEKDEYNSFMTASDRSLTAHLRLYTLQSCYSLVVNGTIAIGTALVVWVGANHVLSGKLTVGELIIFTSYLASLYIPINKISQTWGIVQGAKVGIWRVFELLDVEQDLQEGTKVFPKSGAKGEITWSDVSFGYVTHQPILKQIDLYVQAGEKVAIVGATGAGKSTFLSLVPRFYDPQAGRVMIDGVDIREFQLKSLRQQISMVLQPPLVFPLTVQENIAYGHGEATTEEIIAAAKMARCHDFIVQLPLGYNTLVGERGANLSEGQKQRLTIARAILRNAPILILDEPTSSVDTETEALIMEGLDQLMAGKTAFIIAHRLATVRQVDRIVVMKSGRIVEQGTFDQLIRQQGAFASLYRNQFSKQKTKRSNVF